MGLPLGIQNNNPGNLIDDGIKWQGLTPTNDRFCHFSSARWGIRALYIDLHYSYLYHKTCTIAALITRYAPPSENDTGAYVDAVANAVALKPTDYFEWNIDTAVKILKAIILHENGKPPVDWLTYPDWYTQLYIEQSVPQ